MIDKELISVIVPVYNVEKYVGACLESLIAQTYDNIEIICVDDGSTDASGVICEEYRNKFNNIVLIHQENAGVSKARNTGLDIAKGEYLFFVDSDDVIPANALETLYQKAKTHSADIAVGNVVVEVKKNKKRFFSIEVDYLIEGQRSILERSLEDVYTSACAKLFSKKAVGKTRFIEGKKINEDGFFVFQCLLNCEKVIQTNDIVYSYLYHATSASHSGFSDKYYDILYFREEKIKILKERFPDMPALANATYIKHCISFLNQLLKKGKKERKREVKETVRGIRSHTKPLGYVTKRDKLKIFLIKNCFFVYAWIIQRGL